MDMSKHIEKMQKKFDEIVLGEIVDEYSYPMTEGRALTYLEGIDEVANPFYAVAGDTRLVPTTVLENDVNYSAEGVAMFQVIMGPLRALLANQESTFLNPLKSPTTITVKTGFADKFIKRGKFYVTMKSISYDQAGTPLLQNVYTVCCIGADDAADTPPTQPDPFDRKIDVAALQAIGGAKVAKAAADVAENTEIESRPKALTMEMSQLYWGYPMVRHFHCDSQSAKNLGFPGPVMGASQGNAVLSEMCHSYFGENWFTSGSMAIKTLVTVHPPENLLARGVIRKKEAEGDKTRVHLDVWLENEKGEAAMVGIASCHVAG